MLFIVLIFILFIILSYFSYFFTFNILHILYISSPLIHRHYIFIKVNSVYSYISLQLLQLLISFQSDCSRTVQTPAICPVVLLYIKRMSDETFTSVMQN
ncbi:hypothetical protein BDC45DRAFT_9220 [Circinella umbellata]|nr:hypothetical protein BDC45DRAFT_9220 [Circinella umbellata]